MLRGLADDSGVEEEALHDCLLVADRAAAAGIVVPNAQVALVLLGASLQLVTTQAGLALGAPSLLHPVSPAVAAAVSLAARIELRGGMAPGSCADSAMRIATVLGGDLRAVSAMRCLKLFLERLGYEGLAATAVSGRTYLILIIYLFFLPRYFGLS